MFSQFSVIQIRLLMLLIWSAIFLLNPQPFTLLLEYGAFTILGIVGATFANATGAGGGVVFVPFFKQMAFSAQTTVATSFAIQCCGMTAGALSWWAFYRQQQHQSPDWQRLPWALLLTVPAAMFGLLLVQFNPQWFGDFASSELLHSGFGVFSVLLALALFATVPLLKRQVFRHSFSSFDRVCLPLIAFVGGGITAWLSIGVGELVAVYLIMRGFNVTFAIACAVIVSAFAVWAGIVFHLLQTQAVYWPVVLFAGAGAIIGGILAKHLVLKFSPKHLKLFFASWILLMGLSSLFW